MEQELYKYTYTPHVAEKKPHTCPVCGGKGVVQTGFYCPFPQYTTNLLTPEQCRSCHGKGIIIA